MIDQIGLFAPDTSFFENHESEEGFQSINEGIVAARRSHIRSVRSHGGVFFNCSLPKQYRGSNIESLRWNEMYETLDELENKLKINLHTCRLYTIEVGATISVEHLPRLYYAEWATPARVRKDLYDSGMSVTLRNKTWSFTGYDKGAEIAPIRLPKEYIPYAIRLEYRRKKSLHKLLGSSVLSPWSLTDPEIYCRLVDIWKNTFLSIPIIYTSNHLDGFHTPTEFKNSLARQGLAAIGTDQVNSAVKELEKTGIISKKNASRIRAYERSLLNSNSQVTEGTLAAELRAKVIERAEIEKNEVTTIFSL
ncbi:MAG: hypothetical protein LWX23_01225 [Spirochaetia bacterium]|nr:hypothetical protein [Spirochaetia bacterium]MCE1208076.1 hypothetical protein [Spirochaetia bacterium]